MNFEIPSKTKKFTFGLMGVGILLSVIGLVVDHSGHTMDRFWSNMFINGFYFFAIALGTLFYLALHYATESGWGVVLKRVFEGVMTFIPIGLGVIFLVIIVGFLGGHHIWHWMDADIYHEGSAHYDPIIAGKTPYLGIGGESWFFWLRNIAYAAVFILFMRGFRKRSLLEDQVGGTEIHFINFRKSALFLVFFAVFSSTLSWDWIMSIDTHWFSTLFGWYTFAGMWVTAMTFVVLLIIWMKGKGYLKEVNESHIHDVSKWVFALSFLWSYLWFSQFMLIWYSDIPEEVAYFIPRLGEYQYIYFTMFIINFAFPMILLMSRDAKRHAGFMVFVGLLIMIGHWLDVYMMVTPGVMGHHGSIGFLEVGLMLTFLGGFLLFVLTQLTKRPLLVEKHPMLEESLHHEI